MNFITKYLVFGGHKDIGSFHLLGRNLKAKVTEENKDYPYMEQILHPGKGLIVFNLKIGEPQTPRNLSSKSLFRHSMNNLKSLDSPKEPKESKESKEKEKEKPQDNSKNIITFTTQVKSLEKNQDGKIITKGFSPYELFQDFKNIELKVEEDSEILYFTGEDAVQYILKKWDYIDKQQAIDIGTKFLEIFLIEDNENEKDKSFKETSKYHFLQKQDVSNSTLKDLFIEFQKFVDLKDQITKDEGEVYYNCFVGSESIVKMLENWDISKERAMEIGRKFIENEYIMIASAEASNVFKDSKALYSILHLEESKLEDMKLLLEKFAAEYNIISLAFQNSDIDPRKDYDALPCRTTKPSYINSVIDDFTKAIQLEFQKHGPKRQWERDAKLWRSTLGYSGTRSRKEILSRIFTILRFAPFFIITEKGEHKLWCDTGYPIATSLSHGSRVMIQTPPSASHDKLWCWIMTGDENGDLSKVMGHELVGEDCEKSKKIVFKRLAATHGISVLKQPEAIKDSQTYYKHIKEEKTSGISMSSLNITNNAHQFHTHGHWAMNIPLGGYNLPTILGEKISHNGEHGHLYIFHLPPEKDKCGGILFGLEGSEFNKYDQTGHLHNIRATSSMISPSYGFKWTHTEKNKTKSQLPYDLRSCVIPKRVDGMFVDLSEGFEQIIEMHEQWNDNWVMETSLKPLTPKKKEIVIPKQTVTNSPMASTIDNPPLEVKEVINPKIAEVSDERLLERIEKSDIPPNEKLERYLDFISKMNKKNEDLQKQIETQNKLIERANEKVELLLQGINENISYEDLVLKNQRLLLEIEELKKKLEKNNQTETLNDQNEKVPQNETVTQMD